MTQFIHKDFVMFIKQYFHPLARSTNIVHNQGDIFKKILNSWATSYDRNNNQLQLMSKTKDIKSMRIVITN
jgi:hypothetical protein